MKNGRIASCRFLSAAVLVLTACGGDSASTQGAVVGDSAGVTIVRNTAAPAWTAETAWRIPAEPVLHIGAREGLEAYQFHDVREARRLSDGRVLAVSGTQLRYFGADGRHLATFGRYGDGPGEFHGISSVWTLPGDTVLVIDGLQRRVTRVDPAGVFVTTFELPSDLAPAPGGGRDIPAEFVGRFRDGSLLMSRANPHGQPAADGPRVATVNYQRVLPAGEIRDFGDFPFLETLVMGGRAYTIIFGRQASAVVAGDRLYYAWNGTYEVRIVGADGTLERIVRKDYRPEPTTPRHRAELIAFLLEWAEQAGEEIPAEDVQAIERAPMAEAMPLFSAIRVDDEGNLWVLRYDIRDLPGEGSGAGIWDVFDGGGHFLGSVTAPARLRITQIGPDFVVGVWRDDLSVEYVRIHDLVKPRGAIDRGQNY